MANPDIQIEEDLLITVRQTHDGQWRVATVPRFSDLKGIGITSEIATDRLRRLIEERLKKVD